MNKIEDKFKLVLNVLCLTGLMLDSGGSLGLRNLSILIILLFAFYGQMRSTVIIKDFLYLYFFFLVSLIPGIIISLSNPDVKLPAIINWITAFLLIPVFYSYIKGGNLTSRVFVISGCVFALTIIIIFFGRLFSVGPIVSINDYIKDHSNGFFKDKGFVSGAVLPNVYFQGTLSLIICGTMCFMRKNYVCFLIIIIALIIAPSRFGFLVLTGWAFFVFVKKNYTRILLIPIIAVLLFIALYSLPFGNELLAIFNGQSDGVDIRSGHIESIMDEFKQHPLALFTGEGPGSLFYSKGYLSYVDNVELSQFEYVRKYGVLSFFIFNIFYFWPLLGKRKHTLYLKGALVTYYIVAFSNPVLFSIFSMLFLTYAYQAVFTNQNNTDLSSQKLIYEL